MIKTILFDLDDTLLDFQKAEAAALRRMLHILALPVCDGIEGRYSEINAALWKCLEKGEITREKLVFERFYRLFHEYNFSADPVKAQETYLCEIAKGHDFIPGAVELLEKLHGSYDLYLVSNGTAVVQDSRIASAGIAKYFKKLFISQRVGANKPSSVFFDRCFAEMPGAHRSQTLIVGDSLSSDILGGKNAGIVTCWFNPQHKMAADIRPDHEIHALAELPELLKRI